MFYINIRSGLKQFLNCNIKEVEITKILYQKLDRFMIGFIGAHANLQLLLDTG